MPDRPNILLVMGDHAVWSMIAGRSRINTPNLNRLAAEGLAFERSYTPVSVCCPARAMLATGSYPWHNGVFNQVHVPQSMNPDLRADVVTYAQRLQAVGYRTGYIGKWHASHIRGPLELGYDEYGGVRNDPDAPVPSRYRLPDDPAEFYGNHVAGFPPAVSGSKLVRWPGSEPFEMWAVDERPPEATHTHFLAERATAMIERFAARRGARSQPWHVEVHFPEPHDSYRPLREFLERYPDDEVELPPSYYLETFAGKPGMHEREAGLWSELTEADFVAGRRHFYAYCEQLDHYVGRILDALAASGQADDTIVVFASDHGDLVGAHRMFIKGWMPYEEGHRIPMVARWPGVIPVGSRTDALVQLHDWAHTFVAIGGAEPLPYAGGQDLTPILRNPHTATGPDSLLNVYYGGEFLYTQRILITRDYKYVFNGFDHDEFYDLVRDPHELHNLITHPAYRATIAAARDQLRERMHALEDPYSAGNRYGAPRYLPAEHPG